MDPSNSNSFSGKITRIRVRGEPQVDEQPCLVVIYGPDLGKKIPLDATVLTLGRSDRCDLVIPLEDVSREHCRIERDGDVFRVRDLASTNGTRVNEHRLDPQEPVLLHPGEHIYVGGVIFKFLDGSDVEALYHEEIYKMAIIDGLTRLYNRRYWLEFLEREMARCARHGRALSLMLFDIDDFKRINDVHGHLAGDHVLREIARSVSGFVRKESCFARFGGDEFAVVMPETAIEKARVFAEKVRGSIETLGLSFNAIGIPTSVSVGLAAMPEGKPDVDRFLRHADENLYAAKGAGRNQVVG